MKWRKVKFVPLFKHQAMKTRKGVTIASVVNILENSTFYSDERLATRTGHVSSGKGRPLPTGSDAG
jgi:hypothetical protein